MFPAREHLRNSVKMNSISRLRNEEEDLIAQIEDEMRKIFISFEGLYNNDSFSEGQDPLEKCLISTYAYSNCLMNRGINEHFDANEDPLKTFEERLQRELDYLVSDMDNLMKKINERKEKLNSIDRNIGNLHSMMEGQKNEPTKAKPQMDTIMKNIKLRFRKEKSDLKDIINKLFSENTDIQDLIAMIIEHHFSEGCDKYVQLEDTDGITEQIELLRRTCLFEINPHDPLQIRLCNLV